MGMCGGRDGGVGGGVDRGIQKSDVNFLQQPMMAQKQNTPYKLCTNITVFFFPKSCYKIYVLCKLRLPNI